MLGALAIGPLDDRVIGTRSDDGGLEIVDHHPPRDPAEGLEGVAMTAEPGGHRLVEDHLDVLVPTPRQDHHEHPRFAGDPVLRIDHPPRAPKIDLRFLARRRLDPDKPLGRGRLERADEAPQAAIAPGEANVVPQALQDGPTLDPLGAERQDALPIRRRAERSRRQGHRRGCLGQHHLQAARVGHGPGQ